MTHEPSNETTIEIDHPPMYGYFVDRYNPAHPELTQVARHVGYFQSAQEAMDKARECGPEYLAVKVRLIMCANSDEAIQ